MSKKKASKKSSKSESVRVRVSPEVKEHVEEILDDLGLNTSEAIRLFLKQVELRDGLPFKVKYPNKKTRKTIESAKEGEEVSGFSSKKELYEDLDI